MNYFTSSITKKGQATVPKDIRTKLGVSAGDKIVFLFDENNKVVLEPLTKDISDFFNISSSKKYSKFDVKLSYKKQAKKVALEGK